MVVNGAKTDGIEAIVKALRGRVTLLGQVSKAHGKCLWFEGGTDLADWQREPARLSSGDLTAPGIFSADGPDPASQALAKTLPATIKGRFADLGAGWGWLSRQILKHEAVTELHLVEAEKTALDCARANVSDARAQFHWADATDWTPPNALDGVIMNPPFHQGPQGRSGDPAAPSSPLRPASLRRTDGCGWLPTVTCPTRPHLPRPFAKHQRSAATTGSRSCRPRAPLVIDAERA